MTIAVAQASKDQTVIPPPTLNSSTGKESMHRTGVTWGKATRSYTTLVRALIQVKFDGIMRAAQPFISPKSTEVVVIMGAGDDCNLFATSLT